MNAFLVVCTLCEGQEPFTGYDDPVPILNFNDALRTFGGKHCYVHITSVANFHIQATPSVPVTIRQLDVTQMLVPNPRASYNTSNWKLKGLQDSVMHKNQLEGRTLRCSISPKFYRGVIAHSPETSALCTKLSYKNLVMHGRSWNCRVEIVLFRPKFWPKLSSKMKNVMLISYPSVWDFGGDKNSDVRKAFPSETPVVSMLIYLTDHSDDFMLSGFYNLLSSQPPFIAIQKTVNFIYLLLQLESYYNCTEGGSIVGAFSYITALDVVLPSERDFSSLTSSSISLSQWSLLGSKLFQSNKIIDWNLLNRYTGIYVGDIPGWYYDMCTRSWLTPLNILDKISVQTYLSEKLLCGVVHAWSLLLNSSYLNQRKNQSASLKLSVATAIRLERFKYFPIMWDIDMLAIRILSCGQGTQSPLAFGDLIHVFDHYTWIAVVATFAIVLIFKCIFVKIMLSLSFNQTVNLPQQKSAFAKVQNDVFVLLKIFLEQNGLSGELENTGFGWKTVSGIFLLTCVVLSNAYKNTNVYNMMTPRVSQPFETIDQLIENGFKLFTRGLPTKPRFEDPEVKRILKSKLNRSQHSIWSLEHRRNKTFVLSEVLELTEALKSDWPQSTFSRSENHTFSVLVDNFHMHTQSISILKETVRAQKKFNWEELATNYRVEAPSYMQFQKRRFRQMVIDCDQLAIILPTFLCQSAKNLRRNYAGEGMVGIGKESIFSIGIGIAFSGVISRKLLKRIWSFEESSIWKHWEMLIAGSKTFSNEHPRSHPVRPTMQGNIVVIFSVWLAGLSLALPIFMLELLPCKNWAMELSTKILYWGSCLCWKSSIALDVVRARLVRNFKMNAPKIQIGRPLMRNGIIW